MSKSEERRERIAAFLKRVDALSDSERTVLRKSGGRLLKDADAAALMVFYKALGNFEEPAFQDRMFPIACMYCMWDKETAQEDQTPLAAAMGQYASEKRRREGSVKWDESEKTDPMERRLIKLLDQRWDTDGILCLSVWRMVKMLKSILKSTIKLKILFKLLIFKKLKLKKKHKKLKLLVLFMIF